MNLTLNGRSQILKTTTSIKLYKLQKNAQLICGLEVMLVWTFGGMRWLKGPRLVLQGYTINDYILVYM